jgi:hypothetical protein
VRYIQRIRPRSVGAALGLAYLVFFGGCSSYGGGMMNIKRTTIAVISAASLFSSCASFDIHNLKAYKLPDESLSEADEATRIVQYESCKLSYGPASRRGVSPDVFLQDDLRNKDYPALMSVVQFPTLPIFHKPFPPDKVIVENLFRMDDEALSAYITGKKFEVKKEVATSLALISFIAVVCASSYMMIDRMSQEALSYSSSNRFDEGHLIAYNGIIGTGAVVSIGGLVAASRYNEAKRKSYIKAADLYNSRLLSLYSLDRSHVPLSDFEERD